jgi:hypothetical protein
MLSPHVQCHSSARRWSADRARILAPVRLLTHTSGYIYSIWSEALTRYEQVTGMPDIATCKNAAFTAPLEFEPGTSGSSRSRARSSAASMPGSPEPARWTSTFWRTIMHAITGITGKVGGALARSLLAERVNPTFAASPNPQRFDTR